MKKGEKHRQHSREFKLGVLEMITKQGKSVVTAARELGVHPNLIHTWKRKLGAEGSSGFVGKGHLRPEDAEVKRLQRELEEVKEERDILKKALAVFSRPNK